MNPINAIAKGTTSTASQVVGGMTQQIRSNLPSVSRAVYGLGLGVGPLIQNIVSEFKEDKEKKKKDSDQNKDVSKDKLVEKSIAQGFSVLSNQMKSMVSLLHDIKVINMSQLNAAQRASVERQRAAFQAEENQLEGLQKPGVAATPTEAGSVKKDKGFLSSIFGLVSNMPFWMQLLGGALVGKGIWDMLDEDTKKTIREAAGELVDTVVESVFKSVGDWLLNNKALAAGMALLIAPTLAARAAGGIAKWLFPTGRAAAGATAGGAASAATGAAAAMAGMPNLEKAPPSATPVTPPGTPIHRDEIGMKKTPGGILVPGDTKLEPKPTTEAPKTSMADKVKGGVGSVGKWLGRGLGVFGIGLSAKDAYEESQRGNTTAAFLHGSSAALMGLAMIPGVHSPFAALGAFGASLIANALGGEQKKPEQGAPKPVQGPAPAATGNDDPFAGLRLGTEAQARERTGGGMTHIGMVDLARQLQGQVTGLKEITAFNDEYHHKKDPTGASQHKQGLALDFSLNDPTKSQQAADQVKKMLKDLGLRPDQFNVIDEYKTPSKDANGGHIHVSLKNAQSANQLAEALGRSKTQLASSSMVSRPGSVGPQQVSPTTVASADADSAGPLAELMKEALDFNRMILTGELSGDNKGATVTQISNAPSGSGNQAPVAVVSADAQDLAGQAMHMAGVYGA